MIRVVSLSNEGQFRTNTEVAMPRTFEGEKNYYLSFIASKNI